MSRHEKPEVAALRRGESDAVPIVAEAVKDKLIGFLPGG